MVRRSCRIGDWPRPKGRSLLKTMIRTRIAGDKEAGKATSEAELD
jgi:hypothetical protein